MVRDVDTCTDTISPYWMGYNARVGNFLATIRRSFLRASMQVWTTHVSSISNNMQGLDDPDLTMCALAPSDYHLHQDA